MDPESSPGSRRQQATDFHDTATVFLLRQPVARLARRHCSLHGHMRCIPPIVGEWLIRWIAMLGFFAALLLADASIAPQNLNCTVSFADSERWGMVNLVVDQDYNPLRMNASIFARSDWSEIRIELAPLDRRSPGQLTSFYFSVPFVEKPDYPLTLKAYADGKLRWKKQATSPWWPPQPGSDRPQSIFGHKDYFAAADDNLPVPTPSELDIVVTDAKGETVGERRYALGSPSSVTQMSEALVAIEASFSRRECSPPPPPIH